VQQNGDYLKFVKHQTEAICLAAVRKNGIALTHVKNKTPKILEAAKLKISEDFGIVI